MENEKAQQRRVGMKRKGPHARAEESRGLREGLRDGDAERQRKHREVQRERERG